MAASDLARRAVERLLEPGGLAAWLDSHSADSLRAKATKLSEELGIDIPHTTLARWERELQDAN